MSLHKQDYRLIDPNNGDALFGRIFTSPTPVEGVIQAPRLRLDTFTITVEPILDTVTARRLKKKGESLQQEVWTCHLVMLHNQADHREWSIDVRYERRITDGYERGYAVIEPLHGEILVSVVEVTK